jgi:hypothetical protein
MTSAPIERGTPVVFTVDNLGLLRDLAAIRFAEVHVSTGDGGTYWGPHPLPELAESGWHLIEVSMDEETFYAPVSLDHFEVRAA